MKYRKQQPEVKQDDFDPAIMTEPPAVQAAPKLTRKQMRPQRPINPKDAAAGRKAGRAGEPIDMKKSSEWLEGFMAGVYEKLDGIPMPRAGV